MKKIAIVTLLAALVLACLGACADAAEPAEVGKPAPEFELVTLDGETFSLSEQRGKVVFLNIWATWCPPCVAEMPDIQKLADAHPDDLAVIGASVDSATEVVETFLAENGITYPVGMDDGFVLSGLLYPTMYIPESVFIDPNGIVTSLEIGSASYDLLEARFQDALANADE